jgi:hypothetical protein
MTDQFINNEHEQLVRARDRANKALWDFLDKEYPKGARCEVMIMAGQKNPSPATVEYCSPGGRSGRIYVRLDNAKKHRTAVRCLGFEGVTYVYGDGDHG